MRKYLLKSYDLYKLVLITFFILGNISIAKADGCNTAGFTIGECPSVDNQFEYCFAPGTSSDEPHNTTYYWFFGDGTNLTIMNDNSLVCHVYPGPGTYTVTLIVDPLSKPKTCTLTSTFTILQVDYAIDVVQTCTDASLNITVNNTDWFLNGVGPKTTGSETVTAAGIYNIEIKQGNCLFLDTNINYNPISYVATNLSNFNGSNISCFGFNDGQIIAEITGGEPGYTYDLQGVETITSSNLSVEFNNLPAGNYNVIITDNNGCPVTQNYILTEPPEIMTTTLISPAICMPPPAEGTLEITNITGGVAPYIVLWSSGNVNLQEPNIPVGEHTYSYIVTDANNCLFFDTLDILNTIKPDPEFTWIDVCLYDLMQFNDQSTIIDGTIVGWNWDFGEGNSSSSQNPSNLFSIDGNHTINLTVTSNYGCSNSIQHDVTAFPIPVASATADNECLYDELIFTDLSTINAPDNITSWIYNYNDGSQLEQAQNTTHLFPVAGDYSITLITSSNNGCVDDTTFTVTVYPIPVANFSNTTICENTPPTQFTNQGSVSSGSLIGWTWDFDDDNNTASLPNPSYSYTTAGVYDVQMIVETDKGCLDTIINPVTVLAKPNNDITADITEDCSPACINFQDLTISNASNLVNWTWDLGDQTMVNDQNPSHCYYNPSNIEDAFFDVSLITTNDLGCMDTLILSDYITSWHNPLAEFTPSQDTLNMYESEFLFLNETQGADFYIWDFGDGDNANDFEPLHLYKDTGLYFIELAVETINGCVDTIVHSVYVNPVVALYVPNTFTPNSDGVNDGFFYKGYGIVEDNLEFMIFDRWGTLIYLTNSNIPWDGTYKGSLVQQDAYVYKLRCYDVLGNEHVKEGHVIVLR